MPTAVPDHHTLLRALEYAVRAPSIYNSQPWRWRAADNTGVDLFADPTRRLHVVDPDGRDLLLSCGAALHHLGVALGQSGFATSVTRFPDPQNCHHLARVRLRRCNPSAEVARLAQAIGRRRTDRRRFSDEAVEESALRVLMEQAATHGAVLRIAFEVGVRARLIELLALSGSLQLQQPGYIAELARWAGRKARCGDGIDARSVPMGIDHPGEVPMRRFPRARLAQSPHSFEHDDASTLMVLASPSDDRLDVLRAGEAASAVLLAATDLGLATTPLSQPVQVPQTRESINAEIFGSKLQAQMVLRVGWAHPGAPDLPPSSRRRIEHVAKVNR